MAKHAIQMTVGALSLVSTTERKRMRRNVASPAVDVQADLKLNPDVDMVLNPAKACEPGWTLRLVGIDEDDNRVVRWVPPPPEPTLEEVRDQLLAEEAQSSDDSMNVFHAVLHEAEEDAAIGGGFDGNRYAESIERSVRSGRAGRHGMRLMEIAAEERARSV